MDTMNNRDFNEWLNKFKSSIATYDYYVDFAKVYKNVEKIKIELNILNSLIGSRTIKQDFIKILENYPQTVRAIPILLAKRESDIYCQDENGGYCYNFDFAAADLACLADTINNNAASTKIFERYCYFMEQTGLFDLLENHLIHNLVDYVTGIETGLDSNGRKNRGGHLMEDLVEMYIKKAGFIKDADYFKEMYLAAIEQKWNIDLSALSNEGKAAKRFDYVIKTDKIIYAIETNFYTSSGSKLNETARSYKMLAQEAQSVKNFEFVWFTDGIGWQKAKRNLQETFEAMEHIYNINDLENGIMTKLFK